MKKLMTTLFSLLFVATVSISCREKKTTGEKVEDAVEETGDAIEDGAEDVEDAVEDATDDN